MDNIDDRPAADIFYYEARAEEELELAQSARHPEAVKSHYLLAGIYLDRVHGSAGSGPTDASAGPNA
jgi:hypothetical protein